MLGDCLASLVRDRSTVRREIIVVDNASADHTLEVLNQFRRDADVPVRICSERRLGKGFALNTGVEAARGTYLVFTDDDVVVEDGWLDALLRPFETPEIGVVGGRTIPKWPIPPPAWLAGEHADLITTRDWGEIEREFAPRYVPAGSNVAVRSRAMRDEPYPFDVELGPRGAQYTPGEDNEAFFRLRRRWRAWYTPEARTLHRITTERMTWPAMRRQHYGAGIGHARVQRKLGELPEAGLVLRVLRFAKAIVRVVVRDIGRPEPLTPGEASRRLSAHQQVGYTAEILLGRTPRLARWTERRFEPRYPR
jgi:glycosyltransferase involved in cell wall biosynthesis